MKDAIAGSRRAFLKRAVTGAVMASASRALAKSSIFAASLPSSPVAIARCRRYDFAMIKSTLSGVFDQLGGIRSLVNGKTVSVKVNITGGWHVNIYSLPPTETVYTHPMVVMAACSLFNDYGARRVVVCESIYAGASGRLAFAQSLYDVALFEATVPTIEWENTRNLGSGSQYGRINVGDGAYVYQSFQVNRRYLDTDLMVSIPKMKNHDVAGITLSMKNLFGIAPSALYSGSAQDETSTSARTTTFHQGGLSAAGGEVLPVTRVDEGYRVPRTVVDLNRARPIDLCIIDGIVSQHGGEGAWNGTPLGIVVPQLLVAGRNAVCTDTVAASVMGYDPLAQGGTKPFMNGDNMLQLAADRGIGTNRLADIDVLGLSIAEARYSYLPSFRH
jgi:uncharacterized protein (DUF362 family)